MTPGVLLEERYVGLLIPTVLPSVPDERPMIEHVQHEYDQTGHSSCPPADA